MSSCYLVVEGPTDRAVLSILLADAIRRADAKIVSAGGLSSCVSAARSLLGDPGVPVVGLLLDADCGAPGGVDERRAEIEGLLAKVAPRDRFALILAVPTLEACLFHDESGLRNIFGDALSPARLERSQEDPKGVLKELLEATGEAYDPVAVLNKLDVNKLRGADVLRNVSAFLLRSRRSAEEGARSMTHTPNLDVGADASPDERHAVDVLLPQARTRKAHKGNQTKRARVSRCGTKPARAPNSAKAVDQLIQIEELLASISVDRAVLFADLVGSTEFKRHHPVPEWLAKVWRHNSLAEACVLEQDGRVVKFLGDGVMAVFEGEGRERCAIRAGLAIIEAVKAKNKELQYEPPRALATKIGIDAGEVFMFEFEQSNEQDPQGQIVDVAFRLSGLAGPQQVVCTDESYKAAGGRESFPHAGPPVMRRIKGADKPLEVRLVSQEKEKEQNIPLVTKRQETTAKSASLLEDARRFLGQRNYEEALGAFARLVTQEQGHFEANLRVGELHLLHVDLEASRGREHVDKAIEHLCTAQQIKPESCRVWQLASRAQHMKFEGTKNREYLDQALAYSETALARAEDLMDVDGIHASKVLLARLLLVRSYDAPGDYSADLARAAAYCAELQDAFNGVQSRRRSEYLVIDALVRLQQGATDLDEIEAKIRQAEELAPDNKNAHLAKAKLIEARSR